DGHIPVGAINAVRWLMRAGIVPMIAHPERNKAVMRSPDAIEPFVREGCLLQLTAASVCGWFGPRCHDTAHELLRRGQVTAVATDAHNLRHRPPVLVDAWCALRDTYDADLATLLVARKPVTIAAGRAPLGLDARGAALRVSPSGQRRPKRRSRAPSTPTAATPPATSTAIPVQSAVRPG